MRATRRALPRAAPPAPTRDETARLPALPTDLASAWDPSTLPPALHSNATSATPRNCLPPCTILRSACAPGMCPHACGHARASVDSSALAPRARWRDHMPGISLLPEDVPD